MSTEFPDYAEVNRAHWNRHADEWVASGERAWIGDPAWGIWGVSNAEIPLLDDDMTGQVAIELGCGTGYGSAWMCRRGAEVVGIDPSDRQLDTARRLADEHGLAIEFIHGVAESVPYPDSSFDFALSEYGAAIWADPYVWIPEAHRLLRPGGTLAFLGTGSWKDVFTPRFGEGLTGESVVHPYFGQHRIEWQDDDPSIEFNLPVSEWFRLFKQTGFEVLDFWEIQAPADAEGPRFGISVEWANRFPSEQAWRLRKVGP
jgi:ubiquinone/menaquinone biosynthesis C-methylase UbiE